MGFLKKWELNGFKTAGNWEEIFGSSKSTDEIFMAWNYARYVNKITEAGKAEYPLPMFVNVWLADWRPSAEMTPWCLSKRGAITLYDGCLECWSSCN